MYYRYRMVERGVQLSVTMSMYMYMYTNLSYKVMSFFDSDR